MENNIYLDRITLEAENHKLQHHVERFQTENLSLNKLIIALEEENKHLKIQILELEHCTIASYLGVIAFIILIPLI